MPCGALHQIRGRDMTPKRRQALEWVARDGVQRFPGQDGEPTNRMLVNMDIDGLIFLKVTQTNGGWTGYKLTSEGRRALEEVRGNV